MIYVYTNNSSPEELQAIERMMLSVNIKPGNMYSIENVGAIDQETKKLIPVLINKKRNLLAFGKKAVHSVATALVEEGLIPRGTYMGKPLVDEENGFFFYGIHLDIADIMKSDDNKYYVYDILLDLSKLYLKWNPFNDNLNFGSSPKGVDAIAEMKKADLDFVTSEYGITVSETKLDTFELISKLIEKVDFTDIGLGKSLSKFEKIKLETSNGFTVNILPQAREVNDEGPKELSITYKDLLSLLKIVVLTGSRSMEFIRSENG
jgi:hypothetical protein